MHAFVFVGKTKEERIREIEKRLAVKPWEILRLTDSGISDAREFRRQLPLVKAGIIESADMLTPEAQNALLKTLEDPPPGVTVFLETEFPDRLLPTVLSRVQLVSLGNAPQQSDVALPQGTPGKILQDVDAAIGEDPKKYLAALIRSAHKKLHDPGENRRHTAVLLKNLLTAQTQLSVNVTPRLVLDNVFLAGV